MSAENAMTKAELLARIHDGWNDLQTYLKTLTEAQMTTLKDAAGWTAKDHLAHLLAWEESILALLQAKPRHVQLGIDDETWQSRDIDRINALLYQQYQDTPLAEVLSMHRDVHRQVVEKIETLSDSDLQLPYRHLQPGSPVEEPIINWLIGDTYAHYADHIAWITVMVGEN